MSAFDEGGRCLVASQPLRAFTEAHNSPTMDAQTERIAGNTWARKAAEKRSTVNVRTILSTAVAFGSLPRLARRLALRSSFLTSSAMARPSSNI